mgnify:CR=1 FL=1
MQDDVTKSERISLIASSQDPKQIQFEVSEEISIVDPDDEDLCLSDQNSNTISKQKYEKVVKSLKQKEIRLKEQINMLQVHLNKERENSKNVLDQSLEIV